MDAMTILACGGTLDKDYDPLTGELVFSQSHLPVLLAQANHTLALSVNQLMLKDSLVMDNTDRDAIYQACLADQNRHIVITHGTDTMPETTRYLADRQATLADKTLVLTGAMRPFQLGQSDASFNLGAALMAVQLLPPGVYLVMNGQVFSADHVQKDRTRGVFVSQCSA